MSELKCNDRLKERGLPYPRTCMECGLFGGCKYSASAEPEGSGPFSLLGDVVEGLVELGKALSDS